MMQREWVVARQAPEEHLRRYQGMSPMLAQALFNRGFEDPTSAQSFLTDSDLNEDPTKMMGMEVAVRRIRDAVSRGEAIVVYGDFDADGLTATALLTQVLTALGAQVMPYIPDREGEGYGLNRAALRKLAAQGARLVITVDCGIRSVSEVEAGLRTGMDIIITDHHSIGPELPPALAVINPQREDCPGSPRLAGVGVAFMLANALLLDRWRHDKDSYPENLRLSDLLDLVAIGTVADLAALNDGQNRRLVRHGLHTINGLRRPGIAALARVARLQPGRITASDIGFRLGPRINAAGRLGSAMSAYRLLSTDSHAEAEKLALELQTLNVRRQQLTRQTHAAIAEQFDVSDGMNLIFAGDENFLPGIVGLAAGRLTEAYYRPAVVLEIGDEESRASCRSIPEFNITQALDECADLLIKHGGHAMAAGFTVHNRNLDTLRRKLEDKVAQSLDGQSLRRRLPVDCALPFRELSVDLAMELERLEPTGHANPPASFVSSDLEVVESRRVGDDGGHLKLRCAAEGRKPLDAIGFGLGDWAPRMPRRIDAVFHLDMNAWNGRRNLQMRLLDIRPSLSSA